MDAAADAMRIVTIFSQLDMVRFLHRRVVWSITCETLEC
jgi:hypothetical protein